MEEGKRTRNSALCAHPTSRRGHVGAAGSESARKRASSRLLEDGRIDEYFDKNQEPDPDPGGLGHNTLQR